MAGKTALHYLQWKNHHEVKSSSKTRSVGTFSVLER